VYILDPDIDSRSVWDSFATRTAKRLWNLTMPCGVARCGNREMIVLVIMVIESYSPDCSNFHYTTAIREERVVVAAAGAAADRKRRCMVEASPPRVTDSRTAGSSN